MSNLSKIIEEYEITKEKFQTEAKKLLKEEFKTFFDQVPEIKTIKWSQYTPYFNDGDECVFGVNEPVFSNCEDTNLVSSWGEYDGDENDGMFVFQGTWGLPDEFKSKEHLFQEMDSLICASAMREVMLGAFGDHCEVTVTKDGIDVDHYEHE